MAELIQNIPTAAKRRSRRKERLSEFVPPQLQGVKVYVWVHFVKMGRIDTLREQYTADVIIRARWREPSFESMPEKRDHYLRPEEVLKPKLYIENVLQDVKEQCQYSVSFNEAGEAYVTEKRIARGTFIQKLELAQFPFDIQNLTITIASEISAREVQLLDDPDNPHLINRQTFADGQAWRLYHHIDSATWTLEMSPVHDTIHCSALSVMCRAARRPGYFVWNIFMIMFLIQTLAFATFAVSMDLPQNRLQISFIVMLTTVTFKTSFIQQLPRVSYLTYMDKYVLATMIHLTVVCWWHALVLLVLPSGWQLAQKVETHFLTAMAVAIFFFHFSFVLIIYLRPFRIRREMEEKDEEYKETARRMSEQEPRRKSTGLGMTRFTGL